MDTWFYSLFKVNLAADAHKFKLLQSHACLPKYRHITLHAKCAVFACTLMQSPGPGHHSQLLCIAIIMPLDVPNIKKDA